MTNFPNTDGVIYFIKEVLPRIRAAHPDVHLNVVGMNPPESIKSLANSQIEVTDVVEDPRPYFDSATVVVVPLRVGGGTRFKIVEAMAKGKAIVSTRVGAEGIEAEHGKEFLLADNAETFAREVRRLLSDPEFAKRLGRAGRQLAEQRYGWDTAVRRLEKFLRRATGTCPFDSHLIERAERLGEDQDASRLRVEAECIRERASSQRHRARLQREGHDWSVHRGSPGSGRTRGGAGGDVVDNGSTDSTADVVAGYPVDLVREHDAVGSYPARNRGIAVARGAILAFTDADCVPVPEWLRMALTAFDDPKVHMVGGEIGTRPA